MSDKGSASAVFGRWVLAEREGAAVQAFEAPASPRLGKGDSGLSGIGVPRA